MNHKEREEVFKAINAVANRINDVSQKLDEVMQKLNANANEKISTQDGALTTITEDVLPSMQEDTSGLSDLIDQILTDIIPCMMEDQSISEKTT